MDAATVPRLYTAYAMRYIRQYKKAVPGFDAVTVNSIAAQTVLKVAELLLKKASSP